MAQSPNIGSLIPCTDPHPPRGARFLLSLGTNTPSQDAPPRIWMPPPSYFSARRRRDFTQSAGGNSDVQFALPNLCPRGMQSSSVDSCSKSHGRIPSVGVCLFLFGGAERTGRLSKDGHQAVLPQFFSGMRLLLCREPWLKHMSKRSAFRTGLAIET